MDQFGNSENAESVHFTNAFLDLIDDPNMFGKNELMGGEPGFGGEDFGDHGDGGMENFDGGFDDNFDSNGFDFEMEPGIDHEQ